MKRTKKKKKMPARALSHTHTKDLKMRKLALTSFSSIEWCILCTISYIFSSHQINAMTLESWNKKKKRITLNFESRRKKTHTHTSMWWNIETQNSRILSQFSNASLISLDNSFVQSQKKYHMRKLFTGYAILRRKKSNRID